MKSETILAALWGAAFASTIWAGITISNGFFVALIALCIPVVAYLVSDAAQ